MSTVLEKLASFRETKRRTELSEFDAAVTDAANGKELPVAKLDSLLTRLGKTETEFANAVKSKLDRRELKAAIDGKPAAERELAKVASDSDAAVANYRTKTQSIEQEYLRAIEPLNARAEKLRQLIDKGEQARSTLIDNCQDEQLSAELRQARHELNDLAKQRLHWIEQRQNLVSGQLEMSAADRLINKSAKAQAIASAQEKIAAGQAAEKEIERIDRKQAEVEKRIADIHERMLAV